MGQKIASDGSDSRRQINLANWAQRVNFSGFLRVKVDCSRLSPPVAVDSRGWLAIIHLRVICQHSQSESTKNPRFLPFPGLVFLNKSWKSVSSFSSAAFVDCKVDSTAAESSSHGRFVLLQTRFRWLWELPALSGTIFTPLCVRRKIFCVEKNENILASRSLLQSLEHFILFNFRSNKRLLLHETHCVRLFAALTDYRWESWAELTSDCLCCDFCLLKTSLEAWNCSNGPRR